VKALLAQRRIHRVHLHVDIANIQDAEDLVSLQYALRIARRHDIDFIALTD
jgi:hypothetical protein